MQVSTPELEESMLMSVKCKKCNNHYPLRDINQHTAQCENEELTEKVSSHGKEHNNTQLP